MLIRFRTESFPGLRPPLPFTHFFSSLQRTSSYLLFKWETSAGPPNCHHHFFPVKSERQENIDTYTNTPTPLECKAYDPDASLNYFHLQSEFLNLLMSLPDGLWEERSHTLHPTGYWPRVLLTWT